MPVFDAERQGGEARHVLHVVHRPLQIANMHSDLAQIALHQRIGRQHIGDVAGRGQAARPQPDSEPQNDRLQHDHDRALRRAGPCAANPIAEGAVAPFLRRLGQQFVLAAFAGEGFHDRVAADGIGHRRAEFGIGLVRQLRGGGHIAQHQRCRERDVASRADGDGGAHRRPAQCQQNRHGRQHDQRRQESQQQRVGEQIIGPHAATDLAHRRARKVRRVPVGRKPLNPVERLAHDPPHDRGGGRAQHAERAVTERHHAQPEQRDGS